MSRPRRNLVLHLDLRPQTVVVAEQRGEREQLPALLQTYRDVVFRGIAVYRDVIRLLRVTDVVDADVVVRAPKERHEVEALAGAEHVACGDLPLTLRDDPVLDTNPLAGVWIGPARDVARGVHSRRARLEKLADRETAVDRQTGALRQLKTRPHTDPEHDEVRLESRIVVEHDCALLDSLGRMAEMKHNALFFVQ